MAGRWDVARVAREREAEDIAAMLERMVRAYGRRVGAGDPVDLARMLEVRAALDRAMLEAARTMHQDFSWAEIAAGLGTSRQAVHARFGE